VFLAIWGAWFVIYWRQKESLYSVRFGTVNCNEIEEPRPEFRGSIRKDPITGQPECYFPPKDRKKRQFLSMITISLLIGIVLASTLGIFIYRAILLASKDS
jgi:hypothetical protein